MRQVQNCVWWHNGGLEGKVPSLGLDWLLYPDVIEEIPPRTPKPTGNLVQVNCFVVADHACDLTSRWSHSGIAMFLNSVSVSWCSKKQMCVEMLTFGSEVVALRIVTEQIEALCLNPQVMGMLLSKAYQGLSPFLTKKSLSIFYHMIWEAAAACIIRET